MMELKDTVNNMLSDDWKKRLLAEYRQAKIRLAGLECYIYKLSVGEAEKPKCGMNLLLAQQIQMKNYIATLEKRMKKEGIEYGL